MPGVKTFFKQECCSESDLSADCRPVIIDVLRATTTAACALESGCARIIPFGERKEVLDWEQQHADPAGYIKGGEQGGLPLEGFDLGNRPQEYTPAVCRGKTLLFRTTNGTRALKHLTSICDSAPIILACLHNAAAVAKALLRADSEIALVAAGTEGEVSWEDVICAGAIVNDMLMRAPEREGALTDESRIALACFRSVRHELPRALRASRGGCNLIDVGYDEDIAFCARTNVSDTIPVYDPREGIITALKR